MLEFYTDEKAKWDLWKRDYCQYDYYSGIVQFETGETICDAVNFRPERRKTYAALGISILGHTDDEFPNVFTEDGERVKSSWFGDTQRTFAIDLHTSRVVEIAAFSHMHRPNADPIKATHWCAENNVPYWFWGHCSVYWPGPGCNPVGPKIKLTRPRKLTETERKFATEFRAAMRAELAMCGWDEFDQPENMKPWSREYKSALACSTRLEDLMKIGWENATMDHKYRVQKHGIVMPTEDLHVPYLIARRPVEENGDVNLNGSW